MLKKIIISLFLLPLSLFSSPEDLGSMGQKIIHYSDTERNREIEVRLWYPTDLEGQDLGTPWVIPKIAEDAPLEGPYPLILLSHGWGGDSYDHLWLVKDLLEQGYLVAGISHPLNNRREKTLEGSLAHWERPLDVSFVLTSLLDDPQVNGHLKEDSIGFVGFSMGGMTGLWLAGAQLRPDWEPSFLESSMALEEVFQEEIDDERIDDFDFEPMKGNFADPRIQAYFLIAPRAFDFPEESLQEIDAPIFVITGAADEILPVRKNARYVSKNVPGADLHIFLGPVGHLVFLNIPTEEGKKELRKMEFKDRPGVDRSAVQEKGGQLAQDFFAKYLAK